MILNQLPIGPDGRVSLARRTPSAQPADALVALGLWAAAALLGFTGMACDSNAATTGPGSAPMAAPSGAAPIAPPTEAAPTVTPEAPADAPEGVVPTPAGGPPAAAGVIGAETSTPDPTTGIASNDSEWPAPADDPDLQEYMGPLDLVSAGLYKPGTQELVEGVQTYEPRFPLWSDGEKKTRYLILPQNTQIDTSDMNHWVFPVGTKAFKEFYGQDPATGQDMRLETRLLEKRADGTWFAISFAWNSAQTAVRPRPYGEPAAMGTMHDIPAQEDCQTCHLATGDQVLGIDAIQLSHEPGHAGLSLGSLRGAGLLTTDPGTDRFELPGDAQAQAALGMMHSNCGSCHQPGNMAFERTDLELLLNIDELADVTATAAYRTSVGILTEKRLDEWPLRIEAGNGQGSAMVGRMLDTDPLVAMPPLARKIPDMAGAEVLAGWIDSL